MLLKPSAWSHSLSHQVALKAVISMEKMPWHQSKNLFITFLRYLNIYIRINC